MTRRKFIEVVSDAGAFQVAEIYAWFGDHDKAFELLDLACVDGDQGLIDKRYGRWMENEFAAEPFVYRRHRT